MALFDHIARSWPRLVAAALIATLAVTIVVAARVARHARDRVAFAAAVERETGLRLHGVGDLEPVLLPSPGLRARAVSVGAAGALRHAEIDALTVHLDLPQLLLGRVRVSAVTLASARLALDPARPFSGRLRAAAARDERRLDTVRLRDVAVTFGEGADAPAPLRILDGDLHWRDAEAPVAFSGAVLWRDVAAEIALWAQRPVELWNGRPSAVLARLRSAPLSVEAQGEVAEGLGFRGHIDAVAADLRALADLRIFDAPQLRVVGAAAVKAEAALTNRGLSFANAAIRLDGNLFEGSFSLRHDEGRPSLAATLAAPDLDVSAWLAGAPALFDADAEGRPVWSARPLDWAREAAADLDLRISARRLRLPPYEASDVALAVLMKSGRLELTVSEASGYGGAARGRLRVAPNAGRVETRGALTLTDIDLAQLPAPEAGRRRLGGVVAGQASFKAQGATPRQLAASLDGRLNARLVRGEVAGLDLEHLVLRPDRAAPIIVDPAKARTTFDVASLNLRALAGAILIDDARLSGPAVEATARGGVDLAALAGSVRIEAAPAGAGSAPQRTRAFYLGGPLFDLQTLPDPLAPEAGAPPREGFPPWIK